MAGFRGLDVQASSVRTRWPIFAGYVLALLGIVLAGLGGWRAWQAHVVERELDRESSTQFPERDARASSSLVVRASGKSILLPPDGQSLRDLDTLYRLAKFKAVKVLAADFTTQIAPMSGVVMHGVALRTQADYPAVKTFLLDLSRTSPHMAIMDLRFEGKSGSSSLGQASLKLLYLYQGPRKTDEAVSYLAPGASSASDSHAGFNGRPNTPAPRGRVP